MLLERLLQHLAVLVIVFQRPYFGNAAKALECSEIEFIYMGEVGVRDDHVGECLDVTEPVCYSVAIQCMFVA